MHNDLAMVKGCQKGNPLMQRLMYETYSPKMFPVSLRYSKNEEDAEDILQEAFIKVFKNIRTFRQDGNLGAWIRKIVINTALNHNRSKLYLHPAKDVNEIEYELPQEEMVISDYNYQELIALIRQLPDRCQVIFNLYAIEGYKHQEIAKMLKISEGTSKSQYARAKKLLQELIRENETVLYQKQQ